MKHKNVIFDKIDYLRFSELGSRLNVSFSSYEAIGNKIIGMDGIKRKVLVAEKNNGLNLRNIIELSKVIAITVKKIYTSIKAGELKKRKMEDFLQSIHLHFQFEEEKESVVLPFYERKINKVHDLPRLEKKAGNWQRVLSKMISKQNSGVVKREGQLKLAG